MLPSHAVWDERPYTGDTMKFTTRQLLALALAILAGVTGLLAQQAHPNLSPRYATVRPATPISPQAFEALGKDGKVIPTWGALFRYNNKFYGFNMIGTDPSQGSATSVIDTVVVPLAFRFADGTVLDPTMPRQCGGGASALAITEQSPLFQNVDWVQGGVDVGNTQYMDAVQRAEWWNFANGSAPDYHVLLNPVIADKLTISVPASEGSVFSHGCGKYGDVEGLYFDTLLRRLIVKLGLQPNQLPYFLTYDVVEDHGVLGYHSTFNNTIFAAGTYVDLPLGPNHAYQDMVVMSQVLGSTFNDPLGTNLTPGWTSPVAPQVGCSDFLEAGDPLTGLSEPVQVPGIQHQFYVQDLAFELWFAKAPASTSVNGWFSMFGTFQSSAPSCN